MSDMVDKLYAYYEERVTKKEKNKETKVKDDASVNQGNGGDPPDSPYSPSSPSSSSSSHSHNSQYSNAHQKVYFKKPLLKLNVKSYLPMFNGEANTERSNNWIRQVELYC